MIFVMITTKIFVRETIMTFQALTMLTAVSLACSDFGRYPGNLSNIFKLPITRSSIVESRILRQLDLMFGQRPHLICSNSKRNIFSGLWFFCCCCFQLWLGQDLLSAWLFVQGYFLRKYTFWQQAKTKVIFVEIYIPCLISQMVDFEAM